MDTPTVDLQHPPPPALYETPPQQRLPPFADEQPQTPPNQFPVLTSPPQSNVLVAQTPTLTPQSQATPTQSQTPLSPEYANLPQARALLPAPTLAGPSPSAQSPGDIVNGVSHLCARKLVGVMTCAGESLEGSFKLKLFRTEIHMGGQLITIPPIISFLGSGAGYCFLHCTSHVSPNILQFPASGIYTLRSWPC